MNFRHISVLTTIHKKITIIENPVKAKVNLKCIQFAPRTLRLGYKNQSFDAV